MALLPLVCDFSSIPKPGAGRNQRAEFVALAVRGRAHGYCRHMGLHDADPVGRPRYMVGAAVVLLLIVVLVAAILVVRLVTH
jgi:hypothetical protein